MKVVLLALSLIMVGCASMQMEESRQQIVDAVHRIDERIEAKRDFLRQSPVALCQGENLKKWGSERKCKEDVTHRQNNARDEIAALQEQRNQIVNTAIQMVAAQSQAAASWHQNFMMHQANPIPSYQPIQLAPTQPIQPLTRPVNCTSSNILGSIQTTCY